MWLVGFAELIGLFLRGIRAAGLSSVSLKGGFRLSGLSLFFSFSGPVKFSEDVRP